MFYCRAGAKATGPQARGRWALGFATPRMPKLVTREFKVCRGALWLVLSYLRDGGPDEYYNDTFRIYLVAVIRQCVSEWFIGCLGELVGVALHRNL